MKSTINKDSFEISENSFRLTDSIPLEYNPLNTSDLLTNSFGPVFTHVDENRFSHDPNAKTEIFAKFTETYKKHMSSPAGIREIECIRVQVPIYFCDIQDSDLFAGRDKYPAIGFGPQAHAYVGYYFNEQLVAELLNNENLSPGYKIILEELSDFWRKENDCGKIRKAYPKKMSEVLCSDEWHSEPLIGAPLYRMSGTQCDYDKLVQLGIPGLNTKINYHKNLSPEKSDAWHLYESMGKALDLLSEVCIYYADMAKNQSAMASPSRQNELVQMENALRNIAVSKPQNFREAIQIVLLYGDISGSFNYGRMDEYLGDLFVNDINSGKLTEEEAIRLLGNMWYIMDAKGHIWDSRVIVGGKGRRNEKNADKLALVIMETTNRVKGIVPQLTLRFYHGQDPALYSKALDVIATGNPYPMIYNDEAIIPSVQNAFKISYDEAVNYLPFGCGEYIIYHKSVGTPSGVINLLQALSVTLHKGINPVSGKPMGLPYSEYESFESFEGLFNSYKKQVEYHVEQLAYQEKLEYDMVAKSANYIYLSMLFDNCIQNGKSIYGGGVKYLGGTLESYGNTNTTDSLTAIKKLVYEDKKLSLDELVRIIDANFEGYEKERRMMLDVSKYGNDNDYADNMKVKVDKHICNFTRDMAEKAGMHSYLIVIINNSANTSMGQLTAASPDGRKAFTYMANANSSAGGADKNGITAYLNSIVKPDTSIHAGAVQNLKFSKEMFSSYRSQTEALLKTYFDKGGAQCMINCIGRDELENAMKEPEKYASLIVRVGGFSARFVELPREVQLEILSRTMY